MEIDQMADDSTADEEDHQERTIIEQRTPTRTHKQAEVMSGIDHHGRTTERGSLDVDLIMQYISAQRGYIEETFAKYGRVAHYTTTVTEPTVEVVGAPSGHSADTQASVLSIIREYATIREDGTIDVRPCINKEGPSGETFNPKTFERNVGRHCRVNVPWKDRPRDNTVTSSFADEYSEKMGVGGTFDDPVLNRLFTEADVPSDSIEAFKRGWRLREALIMEDE